MTYSEAVEKLHPYRPYTIKELLSGAYTPGKTQVYHSHFIQLHVEHYIGRWAYIPPIVKRKKAMVSESFWSTEIGKALLTIAEAHKLSKGALADKLLHFIELGKTLGELLENIISPPSAKR